MGPSIQLVVEDTEGSGPNGGRIPVRIEMDRDPVGSKDSPYEADDFRSVPPNLSTQVSGTIPFLLVDPGHRFCDHHDAVSVVRGIGGKQIVHVDGISVTGCAQLEIRDPFDKSVF